MTSENSYHIYWKYCMLREFHKKRHKATMATKNIKSLTDINDFSRKISIDIEF